MNRAYSVLTVKSVDDEQRLIRGIATTPSTDRVGDIVEPLGVKFSNPMPLLWQHQHDKPVGNVSFDKPTEKGITFTARLAKIVEPGALKDRVDEAWQSVKAGLVKGVSIGFRDIEHSLLDNGGWRFIKTEVFELSLVTIPANVDATITAIKSADLPLLRKTHSFRQKDLAMDIHAQLAALEQRRDELSNDMKSFGDVTELDAEQAGEFDRISREFEEVETHLARVSRLAKAASSAKPIQVTRGENFSRTSTKLEDRKEQLAPGIAFARIAKVRALSRLDGESPRTIAKELYGTDSSAFQFFARAVVPAGTTIDPTWASPLVPPVSAAIADFLEFLRPMTILGKFGTNGIPSLRRIPFRTRILGQTTGGQGYWVAEGAPKPLTKFDFSSTSLSPLKVANIAVATMELLRDSTPSAEAIIRDQLAAALTARLDIDFVDPAKAAVAGVSPASITNGVVALVSSGNTADNVRADIIAMFETFIAASNVPSQGVWIMPTSVALALSLQYNPLGQPEWPGISITGGTLFGLPVIVSDYLGPPYMASNTVVLVNASQIYLADEGGVTVDMSQEASLQMDDAPTNSSAPVVPTTVVSMFQTNSVAFRAERTINWAKARPTSVAVLTAVHWGGA